MTLQTCFCRWGVNSLFEPSFRRHKLRPLHLDFGLCCLGYFQVVQKACLYDLERTRSWRRCTRFRPAPASLETGINRPAAQLVTPAEPFKRALIIMRPTIPDGLGVQHADVATVVASSVGWLAVCCQFNVKLSMLVQTLVGHIAWNVIVA